MTLSYIIDHIWDILLTILGGTGVFYLFKINKNQKITLTNSPNSNVITVQNMNNSNITTLKEGLKKSKSVLGEIPQVKEDPKNLLFKIERYLDESKPLSIIAGMCLRLSRQLNMKEDEEWLAKEVYGFEELLKEAENNKGMKMKKVDDSSYYRSVEAKFHIQARNFPVQTFPLRMFISQPLSFIESWNKKLTENPTPTQNREYAIMKAPPLELMVQTLKISPETQVPYIISISELNRILMEVRKRILGFLEKASKRLN